MSDQDEPTRSRKRSATTYLSQLIYTCSAPYLAANEIRSFGQFDIGLLIYLFFAVAVGSIAYSVGIGTYKNTVLLEHAATSPVFVIFNWVIVASAINWFCGKISKKNTVKTGLIIIIYFLSFCYILSGAVLCLVAPLLAGYGSGMKYGSWDYAGKSMYFYLIIKLFVTAVYMPQALRVAHDLRFIVGAPISVFGWLLLTAIQLIIWLGLGWHIEGESPYSLASGK